MQSRCRGYHHTPAMNSELPGHQIKVAPLIHHPTHLEFELIGVCLSPVLKMSIHLDCWREKEGWKHFALEFLQQIMKHSPKWVVKAIPSITITLTYRPRAIIQIITLPNTFLKPKDIQINSEISGSKHNDLARQFGRKWEEKVRKD